MLESHRASRHGVFKQAFFTLGGRWALSSALVRRRMKSFTMPLSSALRSAPRACTHPHVSDHFNPLQAYNLPSAGMQDAVLR